MNEKAQYFIGLSFFIRVIYTSDISNRDRRNKYNIFKSMTVLNILLK